ncbi:hypothetical protein, partial [Streptococcus pneumoniae]|uniref:hypothetical protein n=1 Tax=Streptococcus pneumoniae TaxID=1313 RepID=UPI0012D7E2D7
MIDENNLNLIEEEISIRPRKEKKMSTKKQVEKLREDLLKELLTRDLTGFTNAELVSTFKFVATQGAVLYPE